MSNAADTVRPSDASVTTIPDATDLSPSDLPLYTQAVLLGRQYLEAVGVTSFPRYTDGAALARLAAGF